MIFIARDRGKLTTGQRERWRGKERGPCRFFIYIFFLFGSTPHFKYRGGTVDI
jgi:hypothetical protein